MRELYSTEITVVNGAGLPEIMGAIGRISITPVAIVATLLFGIRIDFLLAFQLIGEGIGYILRADFKEGFHAIKTGIKILLPHHDPIYD